MISFLHDSMVYKKEVDGIPLCVLDYGYLDFKSWMSMSLAQINVTQNQANTFPSQSPKEIKSPLTSRRVFLFCLFNVDEIIKRIVIITSNLAGHTNKYIFSQPVQKLKLTLATTLR